MRKCQPPLHVRHTIGTPAAWPFLQNVRRDGVGAEARQQASDGTGIAYGVEQRVDAGVRIDGKKSCKSR